MKNILLVIMLVILSCQWCSANNLNYATKVSIIQPKKLTIYDIAARRIISVWDAVIGRNNNEGIIGRCFGMARKLKMLMPLMIFKLGVIVTILVFLTIFSLKSLALLVGLIVMNVGGIASKFALLKHDSGGHSPPQNVHFHIHPGKDGNFHSAPSAPWDRMEDEGSFESTGSSNLYNKLLRNPNFKSNLIYHDSSNMYNYT
ncbi:unnamed protein product [Brassicogethes aeneus]|uniref:Uncharacterized protein n=1 Tax=Brassicogethes aeneus TaxID=1431903 RepID=A0A9P0B019_BRAAE|nr:unnamed protein product [Brassicogethes aeneus]